MATTLKELLGAILSDVVRAQHDSNMRLKALSEQYAADGRLAGLKMPTASIGNLTLSLNYAVADGITQQEERGVNDRGIDKTLRYVSNEVAGLLVKTLVHCIQDSGVDYSRYAFVDTLVDNKEFLRHLRRRFYALLGEEGEALLDADAKLREEPIGRILHTAAEENLLDHEDIRGLFMQPDAEGLRDHIFSEFGRVLHKELDDVLRESTMQSFRRIQRYGSLNIELGDERLAQLPPERIHTLTLTIGSAGEELKVESSEHHPSITHNP